MTNPLLRARLGPRDRPNTGAFAYLGRFLVAFFFGAGGVASILRNTASALGVSCCGFDLFMAGA